MIVAASDIHPFEQTVSVIGPVVAGFIVLVLFFKVLGWIGGKFSSVNRQLKLKGVLEPDSMCDVHFSGGVMHNVTFLGFIEAADGKHAIPFEFQRMLILEHADGKRTLLPAKQIRMIEVHRREAR